MKKLLLSDHFTGLANDLARLINGNAAMEALEMAAKDCSDLDVSKYGYKHLGGAALFSGYAAVVRDHLGHLPLLEDLAQSSVLLSVEQIEECLTDREPELEAAFAALPDVLTEDEEEEQGEKVAEEKADGEPSSCKGKEKADDGLSGSQGEGKADEGLGHSRWAESPKAAETEVVGEEASTEKQPTPEKEVGGS